MEAYIYRITSRPGNARLPHRVDTGGSPLALMPPRSVCLTDAGSGSVRHSLPSLLPKIDLNIRIQKKHDCRPERMDSPDPNSRRGSSSFRNTSPNTSPPPPILDTTNSSVSIIYKCSYKPRTTTPQYAILDIEDLGIDQSSYQSSNRKQI